MIWSLLCVLVAIVAIVFIIRDIYARNRDNTHPQ